MAIKYADKIINEIKERGPIITSETSVNGEEFEKWLYGEERVLFCCKRKNDQSNCNRK